MKEKSSWFVLYNTDKTNLPKRIDLIDVNGKKSSIDINELVSIKIKESIDNFKKDIAKIDFLGYVGDRNPFSNEQLNEQILFALNQKIEERFALESNKENEWKDIEEGEMKEVRQLEKEGKIGFKKEEVKKE